MAFRPNWYEEPPRRGGGFLGDWRSWSAMKTLVILIGLGFLTQLLLRLFGGPAAERELVYWLGLRTWGGTEGELSFNWLFPLQLFTYPLIHADGGHIFWNLLFLWIYGQFIEPQMGKAQFLRLFVGGAVVGGLLQWIVSFGVKLPIPTVGCSGAVLAVMVMTACKFPHQRLMLLFPPIPVPMWLLVGFYVLMDLSSFVSGTAGVTAVAAHLGGAAFGYVWHKRGDVVGQAVEKRKRDKAMAAFQAESDDRREMDRILAKIQATGLNSLSTDERAFLERRSRELRKDER